MVAYEVCIVEAALARWRSLPVQVRLRVQARLEEVARLAVRHPPPRPLSLRIAGVAPLGYHFEEDGSWVRYRVDDAALQVALLEVGCLKPRGLAALQGGGAGGEAPR